MPNWVPKTQHAIEKRQQVVKITSNPYLVVPFLTQNHPTMKKSCYLPRILFLAFTFHLSATNIRVTDLKTETTGSNLTLRCTLSWDNAWRDLAMNNHDAAWVFLKFRPNDPEYNSRHLLALPEGHRVMASSNCPAPEFEVSADGAGMFIFLSKNYRGRVEWALELAFDPAGLGRLDAKNGVWSLHAIEMVLVPAGAFTLGDPEPAAQKAASFFRVGASGDPDGLYTIQEENQVVPVGNTPGNLNYHAATPEYQGDGKGPVPAAFPKGVAAFYTMKYEITQGQYALFLNALGRQASYFRANFSGKGYEKDRGSIHLNNDQYVAKSPGRPLNFVSWDDGCAFADWAGLRPMTELEFEKACRGTTTPIPHEFPWGTADKKQLARFVDLDDEVKFRAGVQESQMNAANRPVFGASACGALDLAGSLWERVVSIGHPLGRAFLGTHGDGRLSSYGYATNEDWPRGDDERGGGFGYRGGGYYEHGKPEGDFNPHSPIGWRNFAAWSGGPRSIAYGFRCVRSR